MKNFLFILSFVFLAACASDGEEQEKSPEMMKNDAIDDFIEVSELESVPKIRVSGQISHEVITDDYVFISDRRNTWLVAFVNRCYDIDGPNVQPDIRYDNNVLRARYDTIRGCRIRDIYPVTDGMILEVEGLIKPYE